MLERLPARVRTPAVWRAAVSPSALLLAGAGMSVAILGGLPLAAAAAVGGLGWLARVAAAVPRGKPGDRVDPSLVAEPWRRFVVDAQQAKTTFDRTVARCDDGPLKERLGAIGERIADGVTECWRIARQGDNLHHAIATIDREEIDEDLRRVEQELDDARDARRDTLERTRDALVAQRQAHERLVAVWRSARDRLQVLNAQLDEAVARAVELSVHTGDVAALNPLRASVDHLVDELESLRLGLEEAGGAAGQAATA